MNLSRLWPWVPLGVLFLAPFFDPRRPARLLHLDLLVLLGFAAVLLEMWTSPLGVPPWRATVGKVTFILGIVYLIARMLHIGFRGASRREPLIPMVSLRWLIVGLALVMVFRVSDMWIDKKLVIDVGAAGVVGAEQIAKGRGIYDGEISAAVPYGDTYGPVNYLSYVPFEEAIPTKGDLSTYLPPPGSRTSALQDADSARIATIAFDLLTVVALFFVGRQLRPAREGVMLGVVLAYAWATYPYTFFVLRYSANDALLIALMLGAFIAVAHPVRRGAMLGLATATKFVSLALAPLFARGVGPSRPRSATLFAVAFALVVIFAFVPFVPDGGPKEIYDRTIGFQLGRSCLGGCSVWDKSDLSWLELPLRVAAGALALIVAIRPPASAGQLAARAGAVLAAVVLTVMGWGVTYLVWFAPFVFIGLFFTFDSIGRAGSDPPDHEKLRRSARRSAAGRGA
jgi:hypothetical protein